LTGVIELAVAIALAAGTAWLTTRAWRTRGPITRLVASGASALLFLVVTAVSVAGLVGVYRLYVPHGEPVAAVTAQATPDQLLVATRRVSGCTGCHSSSDNLPLDGGDTNFLARNGPGLGVLVAPNLTPVGPLKNWTDGEIVRAIREGIDRDGHPLLIMPSDAFHHLSDADVSLLVAYLRSQPSVEHPTPPRDLNLLGLVLVGSGLFPTAEQPHINQPQAAPPAGATREYGQYLVDITGCRTCHGANLGGGTPGGFGPPAGPNLRAIVPTWPEGDFVRFFRTGSDPSGRRVDPTLMPWQDLGKAYTDDELRAIFAYLHALG
jgi:mono/diheme cytochrome c family protein